MEKEMIVKIEKCLEKLQKKTVRVSQSGFILNQFFIEKMMYKIQYDTLNLRDETKEVYLSLNFNQVYQVEISENKIVLFLDNDTKIELGLFKEEYNGKFTINRKIPNSFCYLYGSNSRIKRCNSYC